MRPEWYTISEGLPYDKMWADDIYWYPLFLARKLFIGTFDFKDTHTMVDRKLDVVDTLDLPESLYNPEDPSF